MRIDPGEKCDRVGCIPADELLGQRGTTVNPYRISASAERLERDSRKTLVANG